jgi:cytochrome P450
LDIAKFSCWGAWVLLLACSLHLTHLTSLTLHRRRQRRLSNPAFRTAAVASYAAAMTSATEKLLTERWRAGGIRDVYTDFNDLSLTIGA